MMAKKEQGPKPFECRVAGRDLVLQMGNCMITLFRQQQELDHLSVTDAEEEAIIRIYNNEDLCRWMAGISIREHFGSYKYDGVQIGGHEFREEYGWNPPTAILEEPSDKVKEEWLEITAKGLENEWEEFEDA